MFSSATSVSRLGGSSAGAAGRRGVTFAGFLARGAMNCLLMAGASVWVHRSARGSAISCFSVISGGTSNCIRVCFPAFTRVFGGNLNRRCSGVGEGSTSVADSDFRLPPTVVSAEELGPLFAVVKPRMAGAPDRLAPAETRSRCSRGACSWRKRTEYLRVIGPSTVLVTFTDHSVITAIEMA